MTTPLTAEEIVNHLQEVFSVVGNVGDALYSLPSLEWVQNDFTQAYRQFKASVDVYRAESNDCDNFERACAFFADLLWSNTPKTTATGLAFGEFWYEQDTGGGHAINFFLYRFLGPDIMIGFYEPQTGSVKSLTQKEISSCTYWRV